MRDIWSFSSIWQDFAKFAPHITDGIDGDSSRHGPAFCRNLLLTIDVLPFLSIAADTPARGTAMWNGIGSNRRMEAVVQAPADDYLVGRHDAVRQDREKP